MRHTFFCVAALTCAAAAGLAACGDDEVFRAGPDAGTDGGQLAEAGPGPSAEGGTSDAGDAATSPRVRLLLSMNNMTTSELVALDLETGAVDGRLTYPGFIGATFASGADPWLLQSAVDVVSLLDAREPWKVVSSWNVAGTDRPDASLPNANPVAVVSAGAAKAYVVRFNRNVMHVLDASQRGDAGAPVKSIDLTSLLQGADADGLVEATSAVYVASKRRVYVLLGNVDFTKIAADGFTALCATTQPSIVGIDIDTDAVVSLGGTGPQGSILLSGYNPAIGSALRYDAAKDRLLVLSAGCNADVGGAAGPIERRRVEEVSLATGAVQTLLSLDAKPFPSSFAFIDGTRAALAFFGPASFWDPSQAALGADFPGGAENLAHDGKGNIVGVRKTFLADGGAGPVEGVKAPFGVDAGAATPVANNPFTDNTGFLSGAELWVK